MHYALVYLPTGYIIKEWHHQKPIKDKNILLDILETNTFFSVNLNDDNTFYIFRTFKNAYYKERLGEYKEVPKHLLDIIEFED